VLLTGGRPAIGPLAAASPAMSISSWESQLLRQRDSHHSGESGGEPNLLLTVVVAQTVNAAEPRVISAFLTALGSGLTSAIRSHATMDFYDKFATRSATCPRRRKLEMTLDSAGLTARATIGKRGRLTFRAAK